MGKPVCHRFKRLRFEGLITGWCPVNRVFRLRTTTAAATVIFAKDKKDETLKV